SLWWFVMPITIRAAPVNPRAQPGSPCGRAARPLRHLQWNMGPRAEGRALNHIDVQAVRYTTSHVSRSRLRQYPAERTTSFGSSARQSSCEQFASRSQRREVGDVPLTSHALCVAFLRDLARAACDALVECGIVPQLTDRVEPRLHVRFAGQPRALE